MVNQTLPFFVYGTLLPGQSNFHVWQGAAARWEPAVFPNGRLYDLGAFPMLLEEGRNAARGMVIFVDAARYDQTLVALDQLEGYDPVAPERSFYLREPRTVYLAHGEPVTAWVYLGRPVWTAGRQPIPHDNWLDYIGAGGK
jgi:gamma-glutamylcyclotransferase (GGCT)/AIG2-like uncharacterized protein YtfP